MERTLYYASVGPITWNDEEPVSAPSDLFVGMNRVALITDSYVLAAGFGYLDTDGTHFLTINWNEDATADRTLSFVLGDGNRTLTVNENFTIGDGNAGTLTFSAASKTLTVENNTVVSQDYTSDASPTLANLILAANGAIKVADGNPQIIFDNANNWLEITGKVGIGTTEPQAALHIATNVGSGVKLERGGLDARWWGSSNGPAYFGTISNDALNFRTNNVDRMTIASGIRYGNVGIGVTDPDTKLEIFNAGDQLKLSFDGTDNAVFAVDAAGKLTITPSGALIDLAATVDITTHDAATVGLKLGGALVTASAAELNILDGVTGVTAAELSYIGDVTGLIQAQLDGKGAGDVTAAAALTDNLVVRGDAATKAVQTSGITLDDSDNLSGVGTIGCGTITTTGDYLLANGNYVGISANERLEFYTAGYAAFMGCNVGIGTTTPSGALLRVHASAAPSNIRITADGNVVLLQLDADVNASSGTARDAMIRFRENNDAYWTIGTNASNSRAFTISNSDDLGTNDRVTISSAGVVTFSNYGAGDLQTDSSGVISAISDENLKNIGDKEIINAIDKIKALEQSIIYYTLKNESGFDIEQEYLGFSAQEVNKIIPEAAPHTIIEDKDTWGIYSKSLIAVLIKGFNEMAQRIEQLEA